MKTKRTRILSAFMAFLIVFLLIPFGAITVFVEDLSHIIETENLGLLGFGYNMLGGQPILSSTVSKGQVFNREVLLATLIETDNTPISISASNMVCTYNYIDNMTAWMREESNKMSAEMGISTKVWLVSAEVKSSIDNNCKYG